MEVKPAAFPSLRSACFAISKSIKIEPLQMDLASCTVLSVNEAPIGLTNSHNLQNVGGFNMRANIQVTLVIAIGLSLAVGQGLMPFAFGGKKEAAVDAAAEILEETMQVPERALPQKLLSSCHCILIFPMTVSSIYVKHASGLMTCRSHEEANWTPLVAVELFERGRGGGRASLIFLAMTEKAEQVLSHKTFMHFAQLGDQLTTNPGPIGWGTDTDSKLAEIDIVAWAEKKGVISGVDVSGANIHQPKGLKGPKPAESVRLLKVIGRYADQLTVTPNSTTSVVTP